MRHCGVSSWGNDVKNSSLNAYALGIEVVGYGERNLQQLIRLTDLVEYLANHYNIPKENIIRHKDITQNDVNRRAKKLLRQPGVLSRKPDIAEAFFPMGFEVWRNSLVYRKKSRY